MAEMIPVDASSPPCPADVIGVPLVLKSEDLVFVGTGHPSKVLEGLNRLRLNNVFCDVILCCGVKEFPGHRNVLTCFSSYFEAMFTTDLMESKQERVSIGGVEPEMIGLMVNYAYTSKVVISTDNVQALLAASHLLNVTAVQEACCLYMERHLDEKNCLAIQGLAEAYSCQMLEKSSRDYIHEHFRVVYQQEEFLSLCVDRLTEILASDHLNVTKEETVFEAAMMWLNKCPSTRRESFEKVLEKIRLPLISSIYLHDVIESLDVVKESHGCQRLISEAKTQDVRKAQPRWSTVPEVIVMVGGQDDSREVFLRCGETFDPLTNRWGTLEHLPFAVRRHGLAVSDYTMYLAGGELKDGSISRQMWQYDHNSWSEMASMNVARCDLGLVALDGYVYAVGGCGNLLRTVPSVERYHCKTNTWELMASVDMSRVKSGPAMATLDGLIYVVGQGWDGSCEKEVYTFNPQTSAWKEVAPRPMERNGTAVCGLKGKIYVIGGQQNPAMLSEFTDKMDLAFEMADEEDCSPWYDADRDTLVSGYTDGVECYNPVTNSWTMCAPMKRRRSWPAVTVLHGKIYVLGGDDDDYGNVDTIERYCDATDRWELVGEMPRRRTSLRCVSRRLWSVAHAAIQSPALQDGSSNRPTRPRARIRGGCQNCGPKWRK